VRCKVRSLAVDSVALAATIGGSLVGLAGVGVSAWSNWLQRDSAKELASLQHEHERELARGARLYERRAPVYEQTLTLLYPWVERVDATERLWKSAAEPEPPELPDPEEWRAMQARLGAHGSPEVSDAYREFSDAISDFFERVNEMRMIRQAFAEGDLAESAGRMEDARRNVRGMLRKLERLVSEELAAL
jgi:hypothetical protein